MAITVEKDKVIDLLREKGRVDMSEDKVFLTPIGLKIARGTLKTYPELSEE